MARVPRQFAKLARTFEMAGALLKGAEAVEAEAKRIARAEAYASGDYHDGIKAVAGIEKGGAIGRVNAEDFKSWWIEAGVEGRPGKAVLRRASEAAGLRTTKGKR